MFEPGQVTDMVISVVVFLLILCCSGILVLVLYMRARSREKNLESRLGLEDDSTGEAHVLRLWHEGTEATTRIPVGGERRSLQERARRALQGAGLSVAPQTAILGLCGGSLSAFLMVFALTSNWVLGLGAAAGLPAVVRAYIRRRAARLSALFEVQLIDALDLAARSLQAGHPPLSAFHIISDNIAPPVGVFFADICQQHALGLSLEDAIRKSAAACSNPDVDVFASSIAIQRRSGGNLAPTIERLALVIRDRAKLTRRVRVLTAQTQFSKWVLLALPIVMFFLLNVINPAYMQPLYTTSAGKLLLLGATTSVLLGAWAMKHIAAVRF